MNEQVSPAVHTPDQAPAGRTQLGWGFWAFWVLALASIGALSYIAGAQAPVAVFTLPPTAMLVFGSMVAGVQGFAYAAADAPSPLVESGKGSGRVPHRVRMRLGDGSRRNRTGPAS